MKQKLTYLCGLAATLLLAAACTNDDPLPAPEQETGSATFHIDTRATEDDGRTTHLYVAQRPTENNDEALECIDHQILTGESFTLADKTARWYKLAFVSVPQEATVSTPDEDGKEYNDYVIDYSGVLNIENQGNDDLAIYRQVIDRWLMPGQDLSETVTLTRLTGQLILNMGKLIDQFPGQVTNITVTLTDVPNQVYVHDNANGEIIPTGTTAEYTYSYDVKNPTSETDFVMYFNLLPFTLQGNLTEEEGEKVVHGCKVAVTYQEEGKDAIPQEYPLRGEGGAITIQRNTKTYVYFNGLESNEFVVRYDIPTDDDGDGVYDDGGIGVDGDEWDGWSDATTTPEQ